MAYLNNEGLQHVWDKVVKGLKGKANKVHKHDITEVKGLNVATSSSDGLMAAADKNKLDGLPSEVPRTFYITVKQTNDMDVTLEDFIRAYERGDDIKVIGPNYNNLFQAGTMAEYDTRSLSVHTTEEGTVFVYGLFVLSGVIGGSKLRSEVNKIEISNNGTNQLSVECITYVNSIPSFGDLDDIEALVNDKADKSVATTDSDGLMSVEDKTKLDGIATGANKTVVDSDLSSSSTNPVQNKVVKTALDAAAYIDSNNETIEDVTVAGGSTPIDVTAEVGQTIVVKEVDASGKPTKWESVEYQPRTHWNEEKVILPETTVECAELDEDGDGVGDGVLVGALSYVELTGDEYCVVYNGVEYICPVVKAEGEDAYGIALGNSDALGLPGGNTVAPFIAMTQVIDGEKMAAVYALDGSTTVTISITERVYHTIPMEYLPLQYYVYEIAYEEFKYIKAVTNNDDKYSAWVAEIPVALLEAMYLRKPIYLKVVETTKEYFAPAQWNCYGIDAVWESIDKTAETVPAADFYMFDIRLYARIAYALDSAIDFHVRFIEESEITT